MICNRIVVEGPLGGAATDMFENELYKRKLVEIDRFILTALGSMSADYRSQMEVEATEETVRFFCRKTLGK